MSRCTPGASLLALLAALAIGALGTAACGVLPFMGRRDGAARVERTDAVALELAAGALLRVRATEGDVLVEARTDRPPALAARIEVRAQDRRSAARALADASIEVVRADDGLELRLRPAPQPAPDGPRTLTRVDYRIVVPPWTRLDVATESGSVRVVGPLGAAELRTRVGDVDARDLRDGVVAASGRGDVVVREARGGRVAAVVGFGDIELMGVHADLVTARTDAGRIRLSAVQAASVRVESAQGDLELERIEAELSATTASGAIALSDSKARVHLSTGSGSVRVHSLDGSLDAVTHRGDIALSDLTGELRARSGHGSVAASGVFRAVEASSASGALHVAAREGSAVARPWRLSSSEGDVLVELPTDVSCRVLARTGRGAIESDFSLSELARPTESGCARRGDLGAGGQALEIGTSSGDIHLRRGIPALDSSHNGTR